MWKFKYELPAGQRCHHLGLWVTVMTISDNSKVCWYSRDKKKWVAEPLQNSSNCYPCKCLRKFKRHLPKHPELKGGLVCLASRYEGMDIVAYWEE